MAGIDVYHSLQPYEPPPWAKGLKKQPTSRVVLCMRPTPIHKWNLPGVPSDFQVWVKRDDLTGSTLSGNKVRKLEFLLADAMKQGCDTVVTAGGLQSNHGRTTAVAARELGLKTHLVFTTFEESISPSDVPVAGNLLLDCLSAATIVLTPKPKDMPISDYIPILTRTTEEHVQKLRSMGCKPYYIPLGGSSPIGEFGYIEAFQEMIDQGLLENFDDIVLAAGTGGTACGLAVANYLTGSKIKIHAVTIGARVDWLYSHVTKQLQEFGLTGVAARDIVDFVEGYEGQGSTNHELSLIVDVFTQTGISLDPDFTMKATRGMIEEMKNNPGRFTGKRVLILQTGGVFTLFDGRIDKILKDTAVTNQIYSQTDAET